MKKIREEGKETCSIPGCNNAYFAFGKCRIHNSEHKKEVEEKKEEKYKTELTKDLDLQIQNLKEDLTNKINSNKCLEDRIKEMRINERNLQNRISESNEFDNSYQFQEPSLIEEFNELTTEHAKAQNEIEELQERLGSILKEYNELSTDHDKAQNEINQLQERIYQFENISKNPSENSSERTSEKTSVKSQK